jgi:type IV pilus assembly protein PilB
VSDYDEKISCLKNIQLFKELTEDELQKIAEKLTKKVYPPNTVIFREGTSGDTMFFIIEGMVEVKRKEPNTGINLTVANLGKGECFGEMALLNETPRSATVLVATEPTVLLCLDKKNFHEIMIQHPHIALSLCKTLAARIEEMNTRKGLNFVFLSNLKIDPDILGLIPEQIINGYNVLPVGYFRNTLTLAMVNPNNLLAIDEVRKFIRGVAIEPAVVAEEDLKRFMDDEYAKVIGKRVNEKLLGKRSLFDNIDSIQSDILKEIEHGDDIQEDAGVMDLEQEAKAAPMIRLANTVIALAIKKGASDIHIEPMEKVVKIRFRVDGMLREETILPKKIQLPLMSRIKIMSKLDITERRLPQDGRTTLKVNDKPIDFRVSTIPTKFGEKIVTRVLDKTNTILGLDKLIIDQATLTLVREMIRKPYGIIYVTGPTGSGKSTTLYSALSELNSPDVNISTVEDPIEYDIPGINQVQVNPDIGLDFARVLRAFLRQDPDIILVGETRDTETAKIAVEAALTGHLVFTTLHANDAPSAFMRLVEMGIEPFLISTSVIGVVAQRLVRRICPVCKKTHQADTTVTRYLGLPDNIELYRGAGCESCGSTGYRGRIGVYEVLSINDKIRRHVAEGSDTQVIREEAQSSGMKSLRDYCVFLLQEGLTTVDEVLRTVAIQS